MKVPSLAMFLVFKPSRVLIDPFPIYFAIVMHSVPVIRFTSAQESWGMRSHFQASSPLGNSPWRVTNCVKKKSPSLSIIIGTPPCTGSTTFPMPVILVTMPILLIPVMTKYAEMVRRIIPRLTGVW